MNRAFLHECHPPWVVFPAIKPDELSRHLEEGTAEPWLKHRWRPFWAHLLPVERSDYLSHWQASREWRNAIRLHFETLAADLKATQTSPSVPKTSPGTMRPLTPNEARYLRSVARDVKGVMLAVLSMLLVWAIGSVLVGCWLMRNEPNSTVVIVLLMSVVNLPTVPSIVYLVRRLRRFWMGRGVEILAGTFETNAGADSFDVHTIDGRSVVIPGHWRGYLENAKLVTAEVCFGSVPGSDGALHGSRVGFVLGVDGRLSVDREAPHGLLSAKASPLVGLTLALAGAAASLVAVLGLSGIDDTLLLMRHWRGQPRTRIFETVRALAQSPPPERSHVEIASATILIGPLGSRSPRDWLIDVEQIDKDAWRRDRLQLLAAGDSRPNTEWRNLVAARFWRELMERHRDHMLEVSFQKAPWPPIDFAGQIHALDGALETPRRIRGTFSSWTDDDGKTTLRLDLGEPAPLPEPTSLRLLIAGMVALLGVSTIAWLRVRRRRTIVKRLAALQPAT